MTIIHTSYDTDTHKLVPVEISKEMACELERCFADPLPPSDVHRKNWRTYWKKALAAAPDPEPGPAGGVMDNMAEAARAVIDRWDTPNWRDVAPTAGFINNLRKIVAAYDAISGKPAGKGEVGSVSVCDQNTN